MQHIICSLLPLREVKKVHLYFGKTNEIMGTLDKRQGYLFRIFRFAEGYFS